MTHKLAAGMMLAIVVICSSAGTAATRSEAVHSTRLDASRTATVAEAKTVDSSLELPDASLTGSQRQLLQGMAPLDPLQAESPVTVLEKSSLAGAPLRGTHGPTEEITDPQSTVGSMPAGSPWGRLVAFANIVAQAGSDKSDALARLFQEAPAKAREIGRSDVISRDAFMGPGTEGRIRRTAVARLKNIAAGIATSAMASAPILASATLPAAANTLTDSRFYVWLHANTQATPMMVVLLGVLGAYCVGFAFIGAKKLFRLGMTAYYRKKFSSMPGFVDLRWTDSFYAANLTLYLATPETLEAAKKAFGEDIDNRYLWGFRNTGALQFDLQER